eukprot:SAG31_NODE_17753_length_659_cov_0.858929_1_plen_23_part_10
MGILQNKHKPQLLEIVDNHNTLQ